MRRASQHTSAPDQAADIRTAHRTAVRIAPSPQAVQDCSAPRRTATNHPAESRQISKPSRTMQGSPWQTAWDQSSTAHTMAPANDDMHRKSQSSAAQCQKYLQPWEYESAEWETLSACGTSRPTLPLPQE